MQTGCRIQPRPPRRMLRWQPMHSWDQCSQPWRLATATGDVGGRVSGGPPACGVIPGESGRDEITSSPRRLGRTVPPHDGQGRVKTPRQAMAGGYGNEAPDTILADRPQFWRGARIVGSRDPLTPVPGTRPPRPRLNQHAGLLTLCAGYADAPCARRKVSST